MSAVAPYTTASAFLEHVSTVEGLSYTVPTSAPVEEAAPTPLLDQQDHALYSSAFFPQEAAGGNTTGFVLARVIEDAYTLELRYCAFSRTGPAGASQSVVVQQDGTSSVNAFEELDRHPGTLPPVSFVFPSRLVPNPTLVILEPSGDSSARQLQVLCVTEAGYLYTLTFPLPSLFYAADVLAEGNWSVENRVESLEGRTPVLLHGVDEDRVVIATAEGQLVSAELTANTEGGLIETELRSPSSFSMRSLIPSFSTRNLASPTKGSFQAASSVAAPSQILSLATCALDGTREPVTLAFGVSRDRKMRIWRLETGGCLRVIDLPQYEAATSSALALAHTSHTDSPRNGHNTALLGPTPLPLVKIVPGSDTTPYRSYLALFSPATSSAPSAFFVYGMATDASGELKELDPVVTRVCPSQASNSLIDFSVVRMDVSGEARWTLWACWDNAREMDIRTVDASELDGLTAEEGGDEWSEVERGLSSRTSLWSAAYFDEQLRNSTDTVADIFMEHVSRPGRYPPSTLDYALAEYQNLIATEVAEAGAFLPEQFELEYPSALERIAAIVGSTVVLEQDPDTGALLHAEYSHRQKLEWLRFLALLNESRMAALYPTCLAIDEQRGVAAVIGRDSISVPIVREAVQILRDCTGSALSALQADVNATVDLPPSISTEYALQSDILPLLAVIRSVEGRLTAAGKRSLENSLLAKISEAPTSDISTSALDIFETCLEASLGDGTAEVVAQLSSLDNAERAVETFLLLLVSEQRPAVTGAAEEGEEATDLTNALLSDAFGAGVEARYELAKGLATVLLVVWAEDNGVTASGGDSPDGSPLQQDAIFPRLDRSTASVFNTLHTLAAFRWMTCALATSAVDIVESLVVSLRQEAEDGFLHKLQTLRMQDTTGSGLADTSPVPTYGLVNTLLRLPDYVRVLLPASRSALPVSLAYAFSGMFRSFGLLPLPGAYEPTASASVSVLAQRLQQLALNAEALEWSSMWPASAGVQYVQGKAHLELGSADEAQLAFSRTASGFASPDSLETAALQAVLPAEAVTSLAAYYIHVVSLFAPTPFDASIAHFAQLALDAAERENLDDAQAENDLWIKLFRSRAMLADYAKAYEVVMAIPDSETRTTCLAHFISIVCENGAASLLSTFSFAGLEADLERNLAFRARNSDPLAKPNYYKVLYAYHAAKGDFRSAGTVMYQEARRLGDLVGLPGVSYRQVATLQCQSYLAATNALSLVPKDHAWLAVVTGDQNDRSKKRRKVAYRIPESEYDPHLASAPVDVLELSDIRKDYTLALARLQLSAEFPELERTTFQLEPETVVALFSQMGRIDQAFAAGCAFECDLSALFEAVAERCIALSTHPRGTTDASWVSMAEEAATWDDSLAAKAWRLLASNLDRHDDPVHPKYRRLVLKYVLANDRSAKPPTFLLKELSQHDLPSLLRILIKHDRLAEAFEHSLQAVKAPLPSTTTSFGTALPLPLFDQLLSLPPGDCLTLPDDVLKQRQDVLRQALTARQSAVEKAERQRKP
ncbi:hypothetical protein JCM10908_001686 [Rhodotorula pacifica]|uniref:uncharacterized protein n=1 Tax=Rhodotorula pacifica TaxID=1495444 RepID=UPI00316C447A